ncbi:MAG: LacI family DNA-binding transcriptional regulator, partial [Eubacterium sp.]|nr:LacI family DNA-binding transcriptional regulator [Eubacterium sp.]
MKCTIQNIADHLGLSRNTVSKALKNSPEVSESTRHLVIKTASDLGYKNAALINLTLPSSESISNGTILFLTKTYASDSEFWATVLRGIESVLSTTHYHLAISIMSDSDLKQLNFPKTISDSSIKGIILVEICDKVVCDALSQFHLPIVSVDMPNVPFEKLNGIDVITMENKKQLKKLINHLIEKGAERFSFIGDLYSPNVGRGFQERYNALCECLAEHQLTLDTKSSMLHQTQEDFRNFQTTVKALQTMSSLPDVFVCGNDWTAIQLIYALQFLGFQIPKDVSIVGFDNIPAAARIS